MTLALGSVIFLVMPRRSAQGHTHSSDPIGRHLTGFDEEVQLGQLGEILENESVVMTIEAYDEIDQRIKPGDEPLWRGVTLADYEKGRWHRLKGRSTSFPLISRRGSAPPHTIRQQIKLEANDSPVLFGLRPILNVAAGSRNEPALLLDDGTVFRPDLRSGVFDYRVESAADPSSSQPGEVPPGPNRMRNLRAIPEALKARFQAIAGSVVKHIPPKDVLARARALESFLRDSGQFTYTLHMSVVDRNLDPIEDFLVNRKEGHCEYFASALTLLLRSIDIPARLVIGFKGGDWNGLAQMMQHLPEARRIAGWKPMSARILREPRSGSPSIRPPHGTPPVGRPGGRVPRELPAAHRPDSLCLDLLRRRL